MAGRRKLGRDVAVVGAGMSGFGMFPEKDSKDLFLDSKFSGHLTQGTVQKILLLGFLALIQLSSRADSHSGESSCLMIPLN